MERREKKLIGNIIYLIAVGAFASFWPLPTIAVVLAIISIEVA